MPNYFKISAVENKSWRLQPILLYKQNLCMHRLYIISWANVDNAPIYCPVSTTIQWWYREPPCNLVTVNSQLPYLPVVYVMWPKRYLRLESSKQTNYVISLWVIIKAIFTSLWTKWDWFQKIKVSIPVPSPGVCQRVTNVPWCVAVEWYIK